jgi:hypothetical protein
LTATDPWALFDAKLDRALNDEQTQETLRATSLAERQLRDAVGARRSLVLAEVALQLNRVEHAQEQLDAAKQSTRLRPWSIVATSVAVAILVSVAFGAFIATVGSDVAAPLASLPFALWWVVTAAQTRRWSRAGVSVRRKELDAAQKRFDTALEHEVTVAVRRAINGNLRTFETAFRLFDPRGLRELADPAREVSTSATEELEALMSSLSGGSIGLSGPRGAGKTTLMRGFVAGPLVLPLDSERIGLMVSAPVRYDAREFVLHLYAMLCEEVLGPARLQALKESGRHRARTARRAALAKAVLIASLTLLAGGAAMLVFKRTVPQGSTETGWSLVVGGYFLFLAWMVMFALTREGVSWKRLLETMTFTQAPADTTSLDGKASRAASPQSAEQLAEQHLEEIRFQQSVASGWSGGLKLPLGMSLSGDSKLTLARSPWTLPEVVEAFRAFARTLTVDRYLVIGIDELDKMETDGTARQFLNDIKGVFGVHRCFYLVSVSEDAMSSFERRGLPFRDVFDSSFDAIQRIGYFTLAESREVLETRVTGLPVPYQALCHCFSGGLPRDLVRVARELVHQQAKSEGELTSLADLSRAVAAAELRGKTAAALVAARSTSGHSRDEVLAWVLLHDVDDLTSEALRAYRAAFPRWDLSKVTPEQSTEIQRLIDIATELVTFDYFVATVLELFTDAVAAELIVLSADHPGAVAAKSTTLLELLAKARQEFTLSPALVWGSVSECRKLGGLAPWELIDQRATSRAFREPTPRNELADDLVV